MYKGVILDTCIWIDVERGMISPGDVASFTGESAVYLSPVTIAELKFGLELTKDPGIKQHRIAAFERIKQKPVLQIDQLTGEIFGSVCAALSVTGRGHSFRVQDIWIASQCIQHDFSLLTRNLKDFDDIPGLNIIKTFV
jgi:predicted nucleic acid-binding protein